MWFLIKKTLKVLGKTEEEIFQTQLWWNRLKIRLLPARYYRSAFDWTDWHHNGSRQTHAYLQRIKQLNIENSDEVYRYNLHPDIRLSEPLSTAEEIAKAKTNDLRRVQHEKRRVRLKMARAWQDMPDNAVTWNYVNYELEPVYRDGPDRVWLYKRQQCADAGGCCGRDCGCCEQPLWEYTWPHTSCAGGLRCKGKDPMKVFGHCTAECACCVITHGVYVPDWRLPKWSFVAGHGQRADLSRWYG